MTKKPIGNATAHVHWMTSKLQRYTINRSECYGKTYECSWRSVARIHRIWSQYRYSIDVMVHVVTHNFPASTERLEQIRSDTADDETLQRLYQSDRVEQLARVSEVRMPTRRRETIIIGTRETKWVRLQTTVHTCCTFFASPARARRKLNHDPEYSRWECPKPSRTQYWSARHFARINQNESIIAHGISEKPFQKVTTYILLFNVCEYLVAVDY